MMRPGWWPVSPEKQSVVASHNPDLEVGLVVAPLPQTKLFSSIRDATAETCPPLHRCVAFIWAPVCGVSLRILTPVTHVVLSSVDSRSSFPGVALMRARCSTCGGLSSALKLTMGSHSSLIDSRAVDCVQADSRTTHPMLLRIKEIPQTNQR